MLSEENALSEAERFIGTLPQWRGRGIVIVAGGVKYFTNAWVCLSMLRRWRCQLPIELWHLGPPEMDATMKVLASRFDVTFVDALEVRHRHPARILNGWELKPYAMLHSRFREVLLLDADNMPLVDPEFLFETPQYQRTGAIFWPDRGRMERERAIWKLCGVPFHDEPEFETGQVVLDKQRCEAALRLTMWYNEHSDFFYQHVHGDKETFHMAWRKLGFDYAMPNKGVCDLEGNMCQHDFDDRRIFQHRGTHKWKLQGNERVEDFRYEPECLEYLAELGKEWDGQIRPTAPPPATISEAEKKAADSLLNRIFLYYIGNDNREMTFLPTGRIGVGTRENEIYWRVRQTNGHPVLHISSERNQFALERGEDGVWKGQWPWDKTLPVRLVAKP